MNKELVNLASQAGLPVTDNLAHFYRLVGERCADICGSQADQKNIRRHFDLPYYDGPSHFQNDHHMVSQYDWNKHYIKEQKL
jgi:hypothetical protein